MPALAAGKMAPDILLPDMHGKQFSLRSALQHGPVLLAFFKISCPICQYTMPFLERICRALGLKAQVLGVSQNDKKDTAHFLREYGISFPVLLEDSSHYPASNAFRITNVPTLFLIAPDGEIEVSSVGWSKQDVEDINRRLAQALSAKPAPVFHRGEQVEDFKAG
ncbi:MAG: peroxiredoxin family protein [Terriglobales bacterium]